MKRYFIYIAALLLLAFCNCQNDMLTDESVLPTEQPETMYELRNNEIADLLSGYFESLQNNSPATRSNKPEITKLNKVRYNNPIVTRSGKTENNGFTICTVDINYGGKEGFAIVVADKRLPVVLAYSPNGKFSELKEKGSENLQKYVSNIPNDIKAVLAEPRYLQGGFTDPDNKFASFPYPNDRDEIYATSLSNGIWEDVALLKQSVLWGQRTPYNDSLPVNLSTGKPYPVGCTNVALSQIMAYHKYPTKYNWNLMANLVNIENNPFAPKGMSDTIASFIRELTTITKTTFKEATDAASNNIPDFIEALNTLGFAHSPAINYDADAIRHSLRGKYSVIAFGQSATGSGHAFVISGYWKFEVPPTMPDLQNGTNLGINWGTAGGWGDGWYLVEYGDIKVTDLGLAKIDPYTGMPGKDYSNNLRIVVDIYPKR